LAKTLSLNDSIQHQIHRPSEFLCRKVFGQVAPIFLVIVSGIGGGVKGMRQAN
jgi:hypothetical protein